MSEEFEKRFAFLKSMQEDFEVAQLNTETQKPSDWILLSKTTFPKEKIVTRLQLENELVLELDKPNRAENLALAKQVFETLKKNNIGYSAFYGGTKSVHIHIFFENKISNEEREAFIDYFFIDIKTSLDNSYWRKSKQMIALEYAPHFKTGNLKEFIEEAEPEINRMLDLKVTRCGIINYALTHKLPEGERNRIIMPNFMAMKPPEDLIAKMAKTQGMSIGQIAGWKETKFYCGQLKKHAREIGLPNFCKDCKKTIKITMDEKPNHNELAEEIVDRHNIVTFQDTDEIFAYFTDSGLYESAKNLIEQEIQEVVGKETNTHYVSEVIAAIRRKTRVSRNILEKNLNLIPLQNGVLDVEKMELVQYAPEQYFFNKHNVVYDPDAKCPKINQFLQAIVKGKRNVILLKEIAGYCFFRHYKFQNIFLLVGAGANGKSVFLNLLISMLGEQCVSQKPLQMLTNYFFSVSSLFNKNANIFADLPQKGFVETGILKALSGWDWIDAEIKHKGSIQFKNYAKLIASCNEIPQSPDETEGFFRRWVIVNFPNKFEGKKENKNLLNELQKSSEISGFFNEVLTCFLATEQRGNLTYSPTTKKKKEIYLNYSNSVKVFCEKMMEFDSSGEIMKSEIIEKYKEYCKKHKVPEKNQVWFFREFYKLFGGSAYQARKDKIMYILGVYWKSGDG